MTCVSGSSLRFAALEIVWRPARRRSGIESARCLASDRLARLLRVGLARPTRGRKSPLAAGRCGVVESACIASSSRRRDPVAMLSVHLACPQQRCSLVVLKPTDPSWDGRWVVLPPWRNDSQPLLDQRRGRADLRPHPRPPNQLHDAINGWI